MARVILDVPSEKMRPFLQSILSLGLDKHSVSSEKFPKKKPLAAFKNFTDKYLLFDWEFFCNELEYE